VRSIHIAERAETESAQWQLRRLCETIVQGSGARWTIHTPVGNAADELTAIARKVKADVIVVEAHAHRGRARLFHRSVVARIVEHAPCSVLSIRGQSPGVASTIAPERAPREEARAPG
jgi:nucleotide-binding universal stress UspA family protein